MMTVDDILNPIVADLRTVPGVEVAESRTMRQIETEIEDEFPASTPAALVTVFDGTMERSGMMVEAQLHISAFLVVNEELGSTNYLDLALFIGAVVGEKNGWSSHEQPPQDITIQPPEVAGEIVVGAVTWRQWYRLQDEPGVWLSHG